MLKKNFTKTRSLFLQTNLQFWKTQTSQNIIKKGYLFKIFSSKNTIYYKTITNNETITH